MAVLAQNTITLIRVDDGTDGKGVASITRQYYVSTSKIAPTGGSWTTTAPAWSLGKYLWTRYEIKYTNPSSTVYTTAYCDSSWEAINEIQIGGRNLALDSAITVTNNTYLVHYYNITPSEGEELSSGYGYLVSGNQYTISVCITPSEQTEMIAAFSSAGYYSLIDLYTDGTTNKQVLKGTFTARYYVGKEPSDSPNNARVYLYRFPNVSGVTYDDLTVHWVKIEKGNKATDWTPAPEDTALSIDEIHNQLDGIDNIITNTQTNFEQKIDSITATVEQTQQAVVDYQGQLTQIRTDISTEIEQVASGLNLTIEEIYNQFSDLGDVTETIRTFFKVTSDGLMIAQDGNPTSTLMGYDHFAVLLNNTEVVKIYQDSMQAPNGIFDSSVTIGPIKFEGYSEGVALKWVG